MTPKNGQGKVVKIEIFGDLHTRQHGSVIFEGQGSPVAIKIDSEGPLWASVERL